MQTEREVPFALAPADRFKLIREAADAVNVNGYTPAVMWALFEAISDVSSNNRPRQRSVDLLREVAADNAD